VAEEIAMIDILPGGRVVCGFVRGIDLLGQEVIPALKAYQADREKGN
jgi:predicted RNA-binding protein